MTDTERSIEHIEKLDKRLNEAIKIIMHEWGYSYESTVEWLDRKIEGED